METVSLESEVKRVGFNEFEVIKKIKERAEILVVAKENNIVTVVAPVTIEIYGYKLNVNVTLLDK